jgi:hypothetical protein
MRISTPGIPVRRGLRRAAAALALALAAGLASGCFNPFKPALGSTFGVYKAPPSRESAIGVVQLLEWTYERRDYRVYETLFTEDYQFYFDPGDSAGTFYRQDPWIRSYELASAKNLFVGGSATEEPASNITLDYTSVLRDVDTGDTLKQATHRLISTPIFLEIQAGEQQYMVQGTVDFYVVQYPDAKIPADIRSRVGSNDWFIYGWVDRTLPPTSVSAPATEGRAAAWASAQRPAAADGPRAVSWGWLRAAYR